MRLDKSIASFVKTLNKVDGVYPASSCGGHKKPRGSQQPLGSFFVIMIIKNKQFLEELQELISYGESVASLEYNDMYETWALGSTIYLKDEVFEPWLEGYLLETGEYKPESEWDVFYSYGASPED
ncbi:MAG TPA: hypothetical protein PLW50_00400 [Smithellaceae bacterium]|nr:hypothetical protein [Smithellaceae bacterium]